MLDCNRLLGHSWKAQSCEYTRGMYNCPWFTWVVGVAYCQCHKLAAVLQAIFVWFATLSFLDVNFMKILNDFTPRQREGS